MMGPQTTRKHGEGPATKQMRGLIIGRPRQGRWQELGRCPRRSMGYTHGYSKCAPSGRNTGATVSGGNVGHAQLEKGIREGIHSRLHEGA